MKNIADELTHFGHKVSVICAKTNNNISSYNDGKINIYPVIEMKPTPFIYFLSRLPLLNILSGVSFYLHNGYRVHSYLNKLNQNFNPSDGFKFKFSQELPIYTDDYTLINSIDYTNYFQTSGGAIFSVGAYLSTANSITSEDARITKRIFIPSRKLRGFEPGKIGPKDGNDYIGGNYGTSFNIASTLPGIFTEVQDLDLSFFFDAANVWGVDYSSTIDENSKIRSATGVALDWFTPIGPLSISYSLPITKNSTDVTETVRFNIGTTF